ncbi:MAG: helix-turn-helix domain-containing protein [Bacillota bacterium]
MEKHILEIVGQRVREKRKERGFSQEELGERAGVHFSYIGSVERAEKNISLQSLERIANALEVEVFELLQVRKSNSIRSQKEDLIYKINQLLWPMDKNDLKKVIIFLTEIMGKK